MVSAVAFSPDGKFLAAGMDDQTIKIWEAATQKLVSTLQGHTGPVKAVAYSSDGKTLASGGRDGEVRLWDLSSGETRLTLK